MSDRMYLTACPSDDLARLIRLLSEPVCLPFQAYVEEGVFHADGPARENPDHSQLRDWLGTLPTIYVVKWPTGHLTRLYRKWEGRERFSELWNVDPVAGEVTPPRVGSEVTPLIRRQMTRAQRTSEIPPDRIASIESFVTAHSQDWLFLEVS